MSKEELEVVEAPAEEAQEVELTPEEIEAKQKKAAMTSFIMGIIAFVLGGWFFGLLGIILGAIAMSKAKKAKGVAVNPSKIFRIIGLVLGILGLVGGIFNLLAWIGFFVLLGLAGVGAGVYAIIVIVVPMIMEAAGASLALLAL